ncbi:Rho termination factor N-terminal domain-containing protein [Rhizomonospora bruguierae]|uniref:Rho termination factor N-terminal domain-containing protein n=1 Tax=Rhizomonospora bruguierae TaxID=1581705 RepID=UPI001BD0213B|nr:Rho termination factor N-terminal domain-containing protein [Micromonospora sp. NBRC 107566]
MAKKSSQQTKVRPEQLRAMKTGEIVEVARQAGIRNPEKMNKDQLIQALGGGGANSSQPGRNGGRGDRPPPKGSSPQEWKNIPGNQS